MLKWHSFLRISSKYLQQQLSYTDKLIPLGSIRFTVLCHKARQKIHKNTPKILLNKLLCLPNSYFKLYASPFRMKENIEVLSQAPQSEFGVCHMACILNQKSKIHPPTQGKIP